MTLPDPARPLLAGDPRVPRSTLRSSRYRREVHGVYVPAAVEPGLLTRCRALLVAVPDAAVSHQTAAAVLGLPAPQALPAVHLTRPAGSAPVRRPGVVAHVRRLLPSEVVRLAGLRVTSPVRTFVDLAPQLRRDDLVALGDAVAARSGTEELHAAVQAAAGRRGAVAARAALELVDGRAGSPAETRTRLLLHRAGFAALRHGVVARDEHGGWLAAPDLADPGCRVAVQYDGLVHLAGGERRWQADVDRDELTRAAGWEVVVLTGRDLRQPHLAVAKVAAAYERAADRARGAAHRGARGSRDPAAAPPRA